jgi:hypothetical protein
MENKTHLINSAYLKWKQAQSLNYTILYNICHLSSTLCQKIYNLNNYLSPDLKFVINSCWVLRFEINEINGNNFYHVQNAFW